MPEVTDYTALLSGSYWNGIEVTGLPVIVTYSFSTVLPAYASSIDGFTQATLDSFQPFSSAEQDQAVAALNEWAAASGLIFIQVAPGEGDITFQNVDLETTSYAGAGGIGFYPFGSWDNFTYPSYSGDLDVAGDIFISTNYLTGDTANYGTMLHEIGHAIGLKHPTEVFVDSAANPPVTHDEVLSSDDPTRTIMASVGDLGGGDTHLLQLDEDAAAFIYGAAGTGAVLTTSGSGTNTVSDWNWDAATETLTQTAISTTGATIRGSSVTDVITGSDGADRLFGLAGDDTIYGGKGNDELFGGTGTDTLVGGEDDDSYYITSSTATIIENPGEGNDTVYAFASFTLPDNVETLQLFGTGLTGKGNDQGVTLLGDGTSGTTLIGGAGLDYLGGFDGQDVLMGLAGPDLLFGGNSADRFVFTALADAPALGFGSTAIGDFTDGEDKIDLSILATSVGLSLSFIGTTPFSHTAGEVREDAGSGHAIVEGDVDGDGTADFQILLYNDHNLQASDLILEPPCYRAGTRILTSHGEVAVERLAVGNGVVTTSGGVRAVTWLGYRQVDCRRHPEPWRVWPVRIQAGAFEEQCPHRDLWLSPDHAVYVAGGLIPIRHLINDTTIAQVPMDTVSYWHVELARHDVLLAEGLPAESYLDTGNRSTFANGGGAVALHPTFDVPKTWREDAVAPLVNDEARVRSVWERLAERSAALGRPLPAKRFTSDPDIRLCVDGRTIRPVLVNPHRCIFILPAGADEIRLVSRSGRPTDARPWIDDQRRLGACVKRIVWQGNDGPHEVPMDHPALAAGWWQVEQAGVVMFRWTDGSAALPAHSGALLLELHLAGTMQYCLSDSDATRDGARRAA